MQRELLSLEKKFVDAHDEIHTLKRYNETAAAHAEYASRYKSVAIVDSLPAESDSLSPPYCNTCFPENASEKLESPQEVSNDSFSTARGSNEHSSSSGNSDRTKNANTEWSENKIGHGLLSIVISFQ